MIIYSEILGKPFESVEDCLSAEREYELKLKAEKERKKREREKLENEIHNTYEKLVNAWIAYMKAVNAAGYDIDTLEEMALIFVEVIDDAEQRQNRSSQS